MKNWLWSVVHNTIIHPIMPFVPMSWVHKAHDWTAKKAWPSKI